MLELIEEKLLTAANLFYLLAVVAAPVLVRLGFWAMNRQREWRRWWAGLPGDTLLGPEYRLASQRRRALVEAAVVGAVVLLFPFVAPLCFAQFPSLFPQDSAVGLKVGCAILLVGFAFSGSEAIKSYVSGLFFYASITMAKGMQIGDRVTLFGHTGRITNISPMFVQLITVNDDFITLPTAQLWSQPVVSANAGARSSLCVLEFFIAPFATRDQIQAAEDTIWESIQASPYADLDHRIRIYVRQETSAVAITAKAYVSSTYHEAEFKSDITSAFLRECEGASIPLAFEGWRVPWPSIRAEEEQRFAA